MLRFKRIPFDNSGYFFIGLLILVLFGFSGYLTTIVSTPDKFDGFFHFHAICMFLWVVTLVIQPFLIRTGRVEWHRRLGKASYILAPALLLSVALVLYSKLQNGGMEGGAMGIFFIVAQKVAGCFRTLAGAQVYARIQSFLSTTRKHQLNVFNELVATFGGSNFLVAPGG